MLLLDLPCEIRDAVYTHLFPPHTRVTVTQHVSYDPGFREQHFKVNKDSASLDLSILRTCSQLHDEVLPSLFRNLQATLVVTNAIKFSQLPASLATLTRELCFSAIPMYWTKPGDYPQYFPQLEHIIAGVYVGRMSQALSDLTDMTQPSYRIDPPMQVARRIAKNYFAQADFGHAHLSYTDQTLSVREAVDLLTPTAVPTWQPKPSVLIRVRFVNRHTAKHQHYCSGITAEYDLAKNQVVRADPVYFYRIASEDYKIGPRNSRNPSAWREFTSKQEKELTDLLWKKHTTRQPWDGNGITARTAPFGVPLKWNPMPHDWGVW